MAWEYFFPQKEMPLAVTFAGRYDVWDFSQHGNMLNEFQSGIRLFDHYPESEIWNKLLNGNAEIDSILSKGQIALRFRTNRYTSLIKSFSFYAEFEGYKAICCNVGSTSSQLFDSVDELTYDIMCPFVFDGKQWTVSIYTKKDIDCSVIAKKYGGGGHKKAAGFQCLELPFKKI
ncbi:MAG: hypothetical protein A4E53_01698 [Pelotomaculum sp. PtaB.Bin104]|nr:MAG: hypothetical protein A4E53_01698 [Pelotomaculum sp. PtaB.Bin104]